MRDTPHEIISSPSRQKPSQKQDDAATGEAQGEKKVEEGKRYLGR